MAIEECAQMKEPDASTARDRVDEIILREFKRQEKRTKAISVLVRKLVNLTTDEEEALASLNWYRFLERDN